jgi:glutaredoxin
MKPDLTLYTLECCPHCEELKEALARLGCGYREMKMDTAEGITALRVNQCFAREAPVLQAGKRFYTTRDLFPNGSLSDGALRNAVEGKI